MIIIRVAHLFSGIEGFRYGLERANEIYAQSLPDNPGGASQHGECAFHTVYSNDFNKYACAISRFNYPDETTHEADIRTVDAESIPDCDLITFGWPCQDNSIAGRRAGQKAGTRSGLLSEAIRILGIKKPKYFIAENVPGLFSVTKGRDFYEAIRLFTDAGFDLQWQILNTKWFLPQNRERIVFIGHLRGERRPQVFPIGEAGQPYREDNGETKAVVNCLDSNYHKGWLDHGQRTMVIARGPEDTLYLKDSVPALGQDSQRTLNRQQALIYNYPHGFNQGGFKELPNLRSEGCSQQNARPRDENGKAVLLPVGYRRIRRLTPVECEKLQGFPPGWTKYGVFMERPKRKDLLEREKNPELWAYQTKMYGSDVTVRQISDTQRYKCTGNAVSTPVITEVGIRLLRAIENGV